MSNPKEDLRKIESIFANLDDDLKDNQDIHQLSSTLVDFFNTTSCKALDYFIQLTTSDEETCYDMQDSTEIFSLFCGCSNVQKVNWCQLALLTQMNGIKFVSIQFVYFCLDVHIINIISFF